MNRLNRLAALTGALTLALIMGVATANEKDRGPTSSSTPPAATTTPPSTSSTPPNTSYSTSRTTAPTDTSATNPSMQTDTSSQSSNGQAVGRPFAQFKDLDTNSDGSISADEISTNTSVSINLAQYDSNKDGKLSESEYARYKNQMARNNPAKSPNEPEQR
jgi:hypothetical protein